jgi:hypothetical protein
VPPAKPQAASRSQNEFGQELIKALGGGAEFGFESSAPPAKRSQASQQHINAMKLLASRGKTQK